MSTTNDASALTITAIAASDLVTITGGRAATKNESGATTADPRAPRPAAANTTMNLSCEPGTNPDYTKVTGDLDFKGAGGAVRIHGAGTYEHFECVPSRKSK